jgi:hypothetical protein
VNTEAKTEESEKKEAGDVEVGMEAKTEPF